MYKVRIKTKFNLIEMVVEDVNSPEMKELYDQPYVEEVYIDTMEHYKQELIKERDEALRHVTGNSYWNDVAQEKNKEILRLEKK